MLASTGLIVCGLVLLACGGELLLRGAVRLASLARLSPAIIGLTVVAAGTSIPELAVSVVAALDAKADIAVANVVGSNLFNLTAILGITALIRPVRIGGNILRLEYPVLLIVTLLCVAIFDHGQVTRMDAGLFVVIYVAFVAHLVILVREQGRSDESHGLGAAGPNNPPLRGSFGISVLLVAAGVGLLAGGAELSVRGAVEIGRITGLSERVIGLTIISAGTGLPELITSLISSLHGRNDIAVGNIIGSNLFNILGILGLSGLAAPLPVAPAIAHSDCWWMLATTILLFPMMFTERKISRAEGAGLVLTYLAYCTILLRKV